MTRLINLENSTWHYNICGWCDVQAAGNFDQVEGLVHFLTSFYSDFFNEA